MWYPNLRNCVRLALPLAVLLVLAWQYQQAPNAKNVENTSRGAIAASGDRLQKSANQDSAEAPEFQAITDRTTELGAEEMPAYWQLLRNAEQESFEQFRRQPAIHADFAKLQENPAAFRGKLMHVPLNVRRILAYEVEESPLKAKRLYEVWGWLDDSPENLYVIVTVDLPPGMSVGASVHERAEVYGYFFKLQGYLPAGGETRLTPLAAPLLVGRMIRSVPPTLAFAREKDWWRMGLGTILIVSLVGSLVTRSYRINTSQRSAILTDPADAMLFEDWLQQEGSQMEGVNPISRQSGIDKSNSS